MNDHRTDADGTEESRPDYRKSSSVESYTAAEDFAQCELGWESGVCARTVPPGGEPAHRLTVPDAEAAALFEGEARELAEALRSEVTSRLDIAPATAAVRVTRALVREEFAARAADDADAPARALARTVLAAQLLLGRHPDRPLWSRLAPLTPGASRWPGGWVDAVQMEVAGWQAEPLAAARLEDLGAPEVCLGPFALADILRVASSAWIAGAVRPGDAVGQPGLDVVDPGFFFPAAGGDRDGLGVPVQPTTIVQGGVVVRVPGGRDASGADEDAGFAIRESWRRSPRVGWRCLDVRLPPATAGARAAVVTRVQLVGRRAYGSGWVAADGGPAGRFGPVRLPPPSRWIGALCGALGESVPDATGFPVIAPPALVRAAGLEDPPAGR